MYAQELNSKLMSHKKNFLLQLDKQTLTQSLFLFRQAFNILSLTSNSYVFMKRKIDKERERES